MDLGADLNSFNDEEFTIREVGTALHEEVRSIIDSIIDGVSSDCGFKAMHGNGLTFEFSTNPVTKIRRIEVSGIPEESDNWHNLIVSIAEILFPEGKRDDIEFVMPSPATTA
jgi:hypothetical protein